MTDAPDLPPIAKSPISALLPLFNAAAYLEQTVGDWTAHLDGLKQDYELLLVDDGSTDRTIALAEALASRQAHIRLLRHAARQGIGAVVRTGLAAATHPLFFCTDFADPYPAAGLDKLLEVIDQVDLVSGYRCWEPGVPGRPFRWCTRTMFGVEAAPRDFPRRLARRLPVRILFALRLTDVTCGFRLYRRSVLERIPIQSNGPFAQVEILAKANFLGCMMTEVPVLFRPRGPVETPESDLRQSYREARQVFFHPEFGRTSGISIAEEAVAPRAEEPQPEDHDAPRS
jgi:glycosyltransferase involved in cell wall biosynthesis